MFIIHVTGADSLKKVADGMYLFFLNVTLQTNILSK